MTDDALTATATRPMGARSLLRSTVSPAEQHAVDCPVCGAGERRLVAEERQWPVWHCRRCTHVYVSPQPSERWLAEWYGEAYMPTTDDCDVYEGSRCRIYPVVARALTRYHGGTGDLLDVGSGFGGLLASARGLGWRVAGVEPSTAALQAAQRRLGAGVRLIRGSLDDAGLPHGSFDAVTMLNVIEHVRDPLVVCRQAFDLLRPGGCLALRCPPRIACHPRWVRNRWFSGVVISAPEHLQEYTRRSLFELMRRAGFADLRFCWPGLGGVNRERATLRGTVSRLLDGVGPQATACALGRLCPPFLPKLLLGRRAANPSQC